MPQITEARLNDARFFAGPNLTRLWGASDDFFSIEVAGEVGAIVSGIQGDTMGKTRLRSDFTCAFTFIEVCQAVDTLLGLWQAGGMFPIQCAYNDFSFVGFGLMITPGPWAASMSNSTRPMTLGLIRQSGNTYRGVGRTLQAPG